MFLCFFLPSSSQCRDSPSFGQVAIQNIHYYNMNLVYGCKVFSFPYFFFSPTSPLLVNFLSFFCLISVSHQFPNPPMPRPTSLHRCCGTPVIVGKWLSPWLHTPGARNSSTLLLGASLFPGSASLSPLEFPFPFSCLICGSSAPPFLVDFLVLGEPIVQ